VFWRKLVDDQREWSAVGVFAQLKSVRQFSDDADVRFAPPFAVSHDVQAGVFLYGHNVADGRLHFVLIALRRQGRFSQDQVFNKIGAGH